MANCPGVIQYQRTSMTSSWRQFPHFKGVLLSLLLGTLVTTRPHLGVGLHPRLNIVVAPLASGSLRLGRDVIEAL